MARTIPTLPLRSAFGAGGYAELALLETLEQGLSGAYTLFHSVDWSRGVGEQEQHGEIDIVVVNQAGDVLLLIATSSNAATIRDIGASSSKVALWGVNSFGSAPSTKAVAKDAGSICAL
jgi:hypothetical protein